MAIHEVFTTCILEVDDNGVAVLTLTDVKRMNPFNVEALNNILRAITLLKESSEAQVLIITGVDQIFSAGGDINSLASIDTISNAKRSFDGTSFIVNLFYELEIPVIAAVNGVVAGAALALMMACDLIIGSENSLLMFSFRHIAFTPDSGTSYFFTRRLGYYKAAELLFLGENINAQKAAELGIFNKVVPAEDLLKETRKYAEKIAAGPMMTIGYDKKLLHAAMQNNLYQQQELESLYQVLACSSEDFREGTKAFAEKRKPLFRGKLKMGYR
ncbi:MAG: enoyl-CoA hydratase-related protein [Oscillospiraceae bacterium]